MRNDREDILFELDANGNIITEYVHGPGIDEPIAMLRNNQTYYYHADGLGSIIAITNSAGQVVQRYEYDSFCAITYSQDAAFKQPYTYTAREYDQESGLYYYRARYYDAKIGRFITQDPIGFAGGDVNFYVMVINNPLRFIDPWGLVFITPEDGQGIVNTARGWNGTPYDTGGKTKQGADCSGSVWGIYNEAGFPYDYLNSPTFPQSPRFKPAPGNIPQPGDVGLFQGHMVIYDPNAGKDCSCKGNRDAWSASRPGGRPFGPANSGWYNGPVQWYRYDKP